MSEQVSHGGGQQSPLKPSGQPAPGRAVWSADQLRRAALATPALALRYLKRAADQQNTSPVLRTVLAEVALRLDKETIAFEAAMQALKAAVEATPEWFAAAAVLADVTCWIGQPGADDVCRTYRDLADHHGHLDRALCARAMGAVFAYQHNDCRRGRSELQDAIDECRHHETPALLAAAEDALTVMTAGCQTAGYVIELHGWVPVPGGQLCSMADAPPGYLTSRLRRRHGTHTCHATGTAGDAGAPP